MVNVLTTLGAPQEIVTLIKIMKNVAKFERDLHRVMELNGFKLL